MAVRKRQTAPGVERIPRKRGFFPGAALGSAVLQLQHDLHPRIAAGLEHGAARLAIQALF